MILGCSTLGCTRERYPRFEDVFEKIHRLGFEGVDVAVFHGWQHASPREVARHRKAWASRIGDGIARYRLTPLSINCGMSVAIDDPLPENMDQYGREFKAVLALARTVGCPNITLNPGRMVPGNAVDEALSHLKARVSVLAELANEAGVTISFEGHEGSLLEQPEVTRDFLREVWPAAGYTFDPSHMIMGGYDPLAQKELLGSSYHVHVRNASQGAMQSSNADGELDVRRFFDFLLDSGYQGGIGVEYFNDFDSAFEETLGIKAIWDAMR